VPRGTAPRFLAAGAGVEALTPGVPGGHLFAYRLELADGGFVLPTGDGEALYLVRRGHVEADLGGTRVSLAPGDSVHARRDLPHALRAGGPGPQDGQTAEVIALFPSRLEELL
jgi:quercetin dioxygenase-like cupin family protein